MTRSSREPATPAKPKGAALVCDQALAGSVEHARTLALPRSNVRRLSRRVSRLRKVSELEDVIAATASRRV
jgi:hypothetical protein